VFINVFEINAT